MPAQPRATTESARIIARIDQFRTARSWTCDDFARRMTAAGCPTADNAISRWKGASNPAITVDQVVAAVAVFGITLDELFGVGACATCGNAPPAGFICSTCGASS